MKNIFFLMKYTTIVKESLQQKFNGQMEAMKALGYEVWFLEWNGTAFYLVNWNNKHKKFIKRARCHNIEWYFHTLYFVDLYESIIKVINENSIDIVYMRSMPAFIRTVSMAKRLKDNQVKFVVEIPTYNYKNERKNEKKLFRKIALNLSEQIWKKINPYVDLYSIIGREKDGEYWGRPAINISNGIDVKQIKPKQYLPFDGIKLEMIAVASMCYWQGYDRMIKAIASYSGNVLIRLHLVGPDSDGSREKWEKMADELNLTDQIIFHGPVYGDRLDELFDGCHLGVGSLGLYRKGMRVGAILKNREYMARGIPFIYVGEDYNIDRGFPYALQIENADTPIKMEAIIQFAAQTLSETTVSDRMRSYADSKMSWKNEMQKVMEAIGSK